MTEWAYQFGPTELRRLGQRMVEVLDPDGDRPADQTEVEAQNTLDLNEHPDGSLSGRFRFGMESAAVLQPLLSALSAPQSGDHRTLTERQGDALAEIVRLAADSGAAPVEGGERPHIAVTVSLDTLRSGVGAATLDDGHTLTPEQTRRLACDAGIVPVVLGGKSQPIDVGETKRLADKRLRRAWPSATADARSPAAGAHHTSVTPTTSSTGPTADPPPWPTWSSSAPSTTD